MKWTIWPCMLVVLAGGFAGCAQEGAVPAAERSPFDENHQGPFTVYIAGDSTAADGLPGAAPRAGWGQLFGSLFGEAVTVENRAMSGRSSKSFIDTGLLAPILEQIQPGDYLFIQFGHNDAKKDDPKRYTEPDTTFKDYLRRYIEGAREKGAVPVLLTPVERRRFALDKVLLSHGKYPDAIRELAEELDVPLIDMTVQTKELYERLGPEDSKKLFMILAPGEHPNYPEGIQDNTHFNVTGAAEVARLVAEGVRELELRLGRHLIE